MKYVMKVTCLCLLLNHVPSFAKETWFCTEESSAVAIGSITACGIGEGADEGAARSAAFNSAYLEFKKLCTLSNDCKDHEITVDSRRTTCERLNKQYKCTRMLVFIIRPQPKVKTVATPQLLHRGMSKQSMLSLLGKPIDVSHQPGAAGDYDQVFYRGPQCVGVSCYVIVRDGKVSDYARIKPELMSDY